MTVSPYRENALAPHSEHSRTGGAIAAGILTSLALDGVLLALTFTTAKPPYSESGLPCIGIGVLLPYVVVVAARRRRPFSHAVAITHTLALYFWFLLWVLMVRGC